MIKTFIKNKKITELYLLFIMLNVVFLTGCGTQTSLDLKLGEPNFLTWSAPHPMHKVYKDYKLYAEKNYSGGDFLWSGGLRVRGDFYGLNEGAELDVKMEGNPFSSATYLHFEFEKKGKGTQVTAWYYNQLWKKVLNKFKNIY